MSYFLGGKRSLGKSYLFTLLLILLIGFSACREFSAFIIRQLFIKQSVIKDIVNFIRNKYHGTTNLSITPAFQSV